MSSISPFDPRRDEKRREAENTEKSSGSEEVVLLEHGMTSPMHPLYSEARKAVQRADDAYIGSPDEIDQIVSEAAQTDLQEDLTVFGGSAEKAEKAGLSPEFDRDGSLIGDAIEENDEKNEKTWDIRL